MSVPLYILCNSGTKKYYDISDMKLTYSGSIWLVNRHTSDTVQMVLCSYVHYFSFAQRGMMCTVLYLHDGFDTPWVQVDIAFVSGHDWTRPKGHRNCLSLDRRLIMLPEASVAEVVWSPYARSPHFKLADATTKLLSHQRPTVRIMSPFQVDHKTVPIPSVFPCVLLESRTLVLEECNT